MPRDALEVPVRRQHHQLVADAQLRQQRVDGLDLDTMTLAPIANHRSVDVVVPIRVHERKGGKAKNDGVGVLRAAETLQKLLQHEARW